MLHINIYAQPRHQRTWIFLFIFVPVSFHLLIFIRLLFSLSFLLLLGLVFIVFPPRGLLLINRSEPFSKKRQQLSVCFPGGFAFLFPAPRQSFFLFFCLLFFNIPVAGGQKISWGKRLERNSVTSRTTKKKRFYFFGRENVWKTDSLIRINHSLPHSHALPWKKKTSSLRRWNVYTTFKTSFKS